MKDCLGQDEIYQLLPGPRMGSSLLPHTENVGLLWNGCLSWAAQAGQGFSSPGLCQKAGGVGVNQAVLSSCRCFLCSGTAPALGAQQAPRWGWAQLPHCCSVICFFRSQFSKSTWWGQRGLDSHHLCLWFHPLHSQERFRNQC